MAAATPAPAAQRREYDHMYKLVLIGDSGVGKSCLLLRFVDDKFEHSRIGTIGVDFRFRTITLDGAVIKLQIWDTAGQERFRTIRSAYYRGADGIILVYDVTNKNSFDHIDNWLAEIAKYTNENPMKLLIGSRADLAEQRVVSTEQGAEVARRLGIGYFETSAKTGTQVSDAFTAMTRDLFKLTRAAQAKSAESKVESVTVDGQNANAAKSGCC